MAMAVTPNKTDSPLIVNANRVLAFPIASQRFQLISRRRGQDAKFCGCVHLQQLAQRDPLECTEAFGMLIMKECFGFLAAEALNHTLRILRDTLYVKRMIYGLAAGKPGAVF
jgi:hypothetical protein